MLRLCCLVTLYVLLAVAPLRADERILSFDSDINVQSDGAFIVTETIRVRAEGRQIRRGIFRDFPTVFDSEIFRSGYRFDCPHGTPGAVFHFCGN